MKGGIVGAAFALAVLLCASVATAATTVATGEGSATGTIARGGVGGAMAEAEGRLLDTREGASTIDGLAAGTGPLSGQRPLVVEVRDRLGLDDDVSTLLVNLVATAGTAPGFITVYDCESDRPETSNLNFAKGQTIANSALVDFTGSTICLVSNTPVDAVVDLVGAFDFRAGPARRIVDTRSGFNDTINAGGPLRLEAGVPAELGLRDIPNQDAVLNVIATNAAQDGWLSFDLCADQSIDPDRQRISSVNFRAGQTVANLVVVGGSTCLTASTAVDVVIDDVSSPPAIPDLISNIDDWPAADWIPAEGRRIRDTRLVTDARAAAGSVTLVSSRRGLAGRSRVAIVNITAVRPDDDGFITAYGCVDVDHPRPSTSSMNYGAAEVVAHTTFVALDPGEDICVFTRSATDFIVDDVGEIERDTGLTLRFADPAGCGLEHELTTDGEVPAYSSGTVETDGFALWGRLIYFQIVGGIAPYTVDVIGDSDWTFEIVDEPGGKVDVEWSADSVASGEYPLQVTVTDATGDSVVASTSVVVNPGKTLPC